VKCDLDIETLYRLYESYYDRDSFTHISNRPVDLKQVVNTNKCLIHLEKHGDKLLITSVIDNLLKGASGQAVHNMNLLFGLHEKVGLALKSSTI
jgi:N-acetyl-gamma-glutamyl-phosphate reductase